MTEEQLQYELSLLSPQFHAGLNQRLTLCRTALFKLSSFSRDRPDFFDRRKIFQSEFDDRQSLLRNYIQAAIDIRGFDVHYDVLSLYLIHLIDSDYSFT